MKKGVALFLLVPLILSACDLTVSIPDVNIDTGVNTSLPVEQQAATVVALTLAASAPQVNTPLASPTAQSGASPSNPESSATPNGIAATIQPNATATTAGTSSATILTVDSNTNCREGPGSSYKVVIILVAGATYQIIARTVDNKYWVITEPGTSTVCWVPAEFSNAFGDVTLLPVTTPSAPTSVSGPINAPTGLGYSFSCAFNGPSGDYTVTVFLTWSDRSNNETGFYVYRDGALIATLPAGSTAYTDIFVGGALQLNTYQVAAYNAQGQALGTNPSSISFTCNS